MITLLIVAGFFLIVVCLADWKRPDDEDDKDLTEFDKWKRW